MTQMDIDTPPTLILRNGRITTQNEKMPEASAIAMADGVVLATGSDADIMKMADDDTEVVDLNKRRVIPGLTDSHTHLIREGFEL